MTTTITNLNEDENRLLNLMPPSELHTFYTRSPKGVKPIQYMRVEFTLLDVEELLQDAFSPDSLKDAPPEVKNCTIPIELERRMLATSYILACYGNNLYEIPKKRFEAVLESMRLNFGKWITKEQYEIGTKDLQVTYSPSQK